MSAAPLIKICPNCETENGAHDSFCAACDWDLMNVPATQKREADSAPNEAPADALDAESGASDVGETPNTAPAACGTLESLENPALRFIVRDGQSVGRSARADVVLNGVAHLEYISRVHARFFRRGEQWFVQYLAQGNFVRVDGEETRDDSEIALHHGSLVALSLATFRWVAGE